MTLKVQRDFNSWFKQLKDDIFEASFEVTLCNFQNINQLAEAAGLSWMTVQNLYDGTTKGPHLLSIYKLARAVGMDMRCVRPPAPVKKRKRAA